MMPVTTRRHFFKFYFTLALAFLFMLGISLFTFYLFVDELDKPHSLGARFFFLVAGISVLFITFYFPYRYYRNSPTLSVDATGIRFNNEAYDWSDLEELELTGKQPFRALGTFLMEGMMFRFKNGIVKYTFDDVYVNAAEIKSFIQAVVIEKQTPKDLRKQVPKAGKIPLGHAELFRGNQLPSSPGIMLWGVIVFILVYAPFHIHKASPLGISILVLFLVGWFFLFSQAMNYVILTDDCLIVKKHNLPWKSHVYPLDKIKEVVFESQGNQPNCLRVITTDFRNKLYPAATLRDKTWLALEKSLGKKGIIVRNECIHKS